MTVLLVMYIPVAASGYFVYGDTVQDNVLQSLPPGGLRYTIEVLISVHLLCGFVIAINPVCQEIEQLFNAPISTYRYVLIKENGKTVMRVSIIFTLYYWFM